MKNFCFFFLFHRSNWIRVVFINSPQPDRIAKSQFISAFCFPHKVCMCVLDTLYYFANVLKKRWNINIYWNVCVVCSVHIRRVQIRSVRCDVNIPMNLVSKSIQMMPLIIDPKYAFLPSLFFFFFFLLLCSLKEHFLRPHWAGERNDCVVQSPRSDRTKSFVYWNRFVYIWNVVIYTK